MSRRVPPTIKDAVPMIMNAHSSAGGSKGNFYKKIISNKVMPLNNSIFRIIIVIFAL